MLFLLFHELIFEIYNLYYVNIWIDRISETILECTHEDDDDQFPKIIVVRGASTKRSCSSVHTNNEINNELLAPYKQSYTKMLCHLIDNT